MDIEKLNVMGSDVNQILWVNDDLIAFESGGDPYMGLLSKAIVTMDGDTSVGNYLIGKHFTFQGLEICRLGDDNTEDFLSALIGENTNVN